MCVAAGALPAQTQDAQVSSSMGFGDEGENSASTQLKPTVIHRHQFTQSNDVVPPAEDRDASA